MRHGYSGARVERISRAARSSDRMIYYYFASKEALYLRGARGRLQRARRGRERARPRCGRPREALDALIEFTWRYYVEHPEFVALLSNENLQRGRHITKSVKVKQLSRPVLAILATILAEGTRQKVFRRGLDVKKVYLTLAALGYFYLSNRFTLSSFLGTDLMRPDECEAWLAEIRRVMMAAVCVPEAAETVKTDCMAAYEIRKGSDGPPLERVAVHVHVHARREPALRERPLRDGRPDGRRQAADARLLDRQRPLGGAPRVLQHQGPRGPADLAPAAPEGRRRRPGRPEADRNARPHRPAARAHPLPVRDRHRPGAVHEHHPRPRHLRALRQDRPGARHAQGRRARLRRPDRARAAAARPSRRAGARPARLLPDRDARAVPQPGASCPT